MIGIFLLFTYSNTFTKYSVTWKEKKCRILCISRQMPVARQPVRAFKSQASKQKISATSGETILNKYIHFLPHKKSSRYDKIFAH